MNEMVNMLTMKVMEFTEKMSKVETLMIEFQKDQERQNERYKQLSSLLFEMKEDVGKVLGRTEKGGVNVNIDSTTNVDGSENVNNETNIS